MSLSSVVNVWRTVWRNAQAWADEHGGLSNLHPVFWLPAVSIVNVAPDTMHIVDLGLAHHVLGNVFFLLCFYPQYFPHANTPSDRCCALWTRTVPVVE